MECFYISLFLHSLLAGQTDKRPMHPNPANGSIAGNNKIHYSKMNKEDMTCRIPLHNGVRL